MGLLFAVLLLGVPLAAAFYDLSKTGNGVGNFKLKELIGMNPLAPSASVRATPAPRPPVTNAEIPVAAPPPVDPPALTP